MNKALFAALVALASVASAGTITNTFDSPAGPISADGVSTLGVTFHFSGGSATYGDTIVIAPLPFTDPVLDGPASGVLTLQFLQAVTSLSFDFVLGPVSQEQSPWVSVALSGPVFGGVGPLTVSTGIPGEDMLAIGAFSYSGSAFNQAVITFFSDAQLFAIDNLVYNQVEAGEDVLAIDNPEPGTVVLISFAILWFAIRRKQLLSGSAC